MEKEIRKGEYNEMPFNIIQSSDILTKDDIDKLIPLTQELKETFINVQGFRTRTEMEVSVLNNIKFPTPTLKYWQAVKEQNVMFQELVMLSYEYRKNIIKIKQLQRRIENEQDDLEKELLQIEVEKKMFISKNQEKTAKDRIRELKAWSEIKEREAKNMSEEDLAEVDNGQLIGYTKRWINQSIQMGDSGSPAERQNLLGQLRSGILSCISKGIINKVLEGYDETIQDKIKEEYGIK
ncbi:MAG: hypothetical protein KAI72_10765 [Candidatus Pacebacteria bacterium]|nr:hypothetical protein [Candidatus Paceibacterota bacterium]